MRHGIKDAMSPFWQLKWNREGKLLAQRRQPMKGGGSDSTWRVPGCSPSCYSRFAPGLRMNVQTIGWKADLNAYHLMDYWLLAKWKTCLYNGEIQHWAPSPSNQTSTGVGPRSLSSSWGAGTCNHVTCMLLKNAHLESNHEGTRDKSRMWASPHDNWLRLEKSECH